MQILIRILAKNKYIFYFFFLVLISFISIFNKNPYYNSSFFNSSNYIVGSIFQIRSSIVNYFFDTSLIFDDKSIDIADLSIFILPAKVSKTHVSSLKLTSAIFP